jgi:LacI family transcriptional regulator
MTAAVRNAVKLSRNHKRPLVGVVVDCANTFGRAILRGVTRYANLQRRWVLFKDMQRVLDVNSPWPAFDGAIFAGVPWEVVMHGVKGCKNVVHVSGGGDPKICPVVALDDVVAGRQAAQHLIDCRLEKFAFYGVNTGFRTADNRLKGFHQQLASRGYQCVDCPLPIPSVRDMAEHRDRPALIQWLRGVPKPIGILALDDTNAHELAEACMEADIGVPEHVAIIGVNNDDLLCESAWPPLSSVDADYGRMGYTAAKVLDRLFSGEVLEPEERLTLLPPLGVVQRQSTNVLAVGDVNLADAIRYIREHACDPCSVDDVMRVVPVGRRWLERQFLAQLGRTPHDEIIRVRIDTAKRLLTQDDLNIAEIAARCGYASDKNFHVTFRKAVGATPAEYRKGARQGSDR